jgi:DNA-binding beta-propeller fold protein YncE
MKRIRVLCVVATLILAPSVGAQTGPSGTVLVAKMDDDSVWLIDIESGVHRTTIQTHIAPHEVALSADGQTAAVTNYGDQRGPGNLLQVFDVSSGTVIGRSHAPPCSARRAPGPDEDTRAGVNESAGNRDLGDGFGTS